MIGFGSPVRSFSANGTEAGAGVRREEQYENLILNLVMDDTITVRRRQGGGVRQASVTRPQVIPPSKVDGPRSFIKATATEVDKEKIDARAID